MNKKKLFVIVLSLFLFGVVVESHAQEIIVDLEVSIIDETPTQSGPHKTPVQIPEVWQDGHLIILEAGHADFVLDLIDEDGILVYTTVVPTATTQVFLPSSFTGDFELQLIQGNFCFYGFISL